MTFIDGFAVDLTPEEIAIATEHPGDIEKRLPFVPELVREYFRTGTGLYGQGGLDEPPVSVRQTRMMTGGHLLKHVDMRRLLNVDADVTRQECEIGGTRGLFYCLVSKTTAALIECGLVDDLLEQQTQYGNTLALTTNWLDWLVSTSSELLLRVMKHNRYFFAGT